MNDVLVVFYKNIIKIILFFVVGRSKLIFFMRQILNFVVTFIFGWRDLLRVRHKRRRYLAKRPVGPSENFVAKMFSDSALKKERNGSAMACFF